MKPKRIILIRHGESAANVDRYLFGRIPDYTIELTDRGKEQAREAGRRLLDEVGGESLYFYISPFWRTRSTFENIVSGMPRSQFRYSEEPRLREQEWGYLRCNEDFDKICRERREYGAFYYRIPGGESGTDVYDRVNDLLGSMYRDFQKDDYPENCVLITHSLTIRLFLMRYYHLTVEDFEQMLSPDNCELVIMTLQEDGKYKLDYEIKKSDTPLRYSRPITLP
ncbi:MAG: phosphoglycerate mutase family protein [Rikenellaceae bacterium]|nr:phosphoglycerate mutase family protein [Rikenellaceae bacterium]